MMNLDTATDAVRAYATSSPRSAQTAIGWSQAGDCARALGYRIARTKESSVPDPWRGAVGTALHSYLLPILAPVLGARMEVETVYRDVPGHADLVTDEIVVDLKTPPLAKVRLYQSHPEYLDGYRAQVHGYAAGLGVPGVALLFAPVGAGLEDWWLWQEPADRAIADAAVDRLETIGDQVRAGLLDQLARERDYGPFCLHWCPFVGECRTEPQTTIDDALDAAAVEEYGLLGEAVKALGKQRDALALEIEGLRGVANGWRVSTTRDSFGLDQKQARALLELLGMEVPLSPRRGGVRVTRA